MLSLHLRHRGLDAGADRVAIPPFWLLLLSQALITGPQIRVDLNMKSSGVSTPGPPGDAPPFELTPSTGFTIEIGIACASTGAMQQPLAVALGGVPCRIFQDVTGVLIEGEPVTPDRVLRQPPSGRWNVQRKTIPTTLLSCPGESLEGSLASMISFGRSGEQMTCSTATTGPLPLLSHAQVAIRRGGDGLKSLIMMMLEMRRWWPCSQRGVTRGMIG